MHNSGLSQGIPVAGRAYIEDVLAEETTWASQSHPCMYTLPQTYIYPMVIARGEGRKYHSPSTIT